MFHSISWRLQLSYGLLFLGMLVALVITAITLERSNRLGKIDATLQGKATLLSGARFRGSRGGTPGVEPIEIRGLRQQPPAFDEPGDVSHYYFIWGGSAAAGRLLYRSKGAPVGVEVPILDNSGLRRIGTGLLP